MEPAPPFRAADVTALTVTWGHLWTIDGVVALATIALAVATLVLAGVTLAMARQARKTANDTRSMVEVEREALRATYRPLLVSAPPALPQESGDHEIRYTSGETITIGNRGETSIVETKAELLCSVPFRNVGTGPALPLGTWVRSLDNSLRATGGPSMGIIASGELDRCRLVVGKDEAARSLDEGVLFFGVIYTDIDGAEITQVEVEVRRRTDGSWAAGRTNLFRPGEAEPYAFGGW